MYEPKMYKKSMLTIICKSIFMFCFIYALKYTPFPIDNKFVQDYCFYNCLEVVKAFKSYLNLLKKDSNMLHVASSHLDENKMNFDPIFDFW